MNHMKADQREQLALRQVWGEPTHCCHNFEDYDYDDDDAIENGKDQGKGKVKGKSKGKAKGEVKGKSMSGKDEEEEEEEEEEDEGVGKGTSKDNKMMAAKIHAQCINPAHNLRCIGADPCCKIQFFGTRAQFMEALHPSKRECAPDEMEIMHGWTETGRTFSWGRLETLQNMLED